MIRLIVTDLDDTLLRSDKTLSARTLAALTACRAAGVKIAFATARSAQAARFCVEQFVPDIFIGYGGGLIQAGGETLRRFDIPSVLSARLLGACLQEPAITHIHATNETAAHTDWRAPDPANPHYRYHDFLGNERHSYLKISVVSADPGAVERIAARFPMLDMLRYTNEDLYRFAHRDAVKWNAVRLVARHYGLDAADIAAFGDDVNDLEMLRNCGAGVAVANAIPAVKAAARFVCASNDDDGVAAWLEEHVL